MDIEELLLKLDFSRESAAHKLRFKKELTANMLSEQELFSVAAAGDAGADRDIVTPDSVCKLGVQPAPCGECVHSSLENGVLYCIFKKK